jgi:SH3-like domain-containing protein
MREKRIVQGDGKSASARRALGAAGGLALICGLAAAGLGFGGEARAQDRGMRATDLPLPRFVSLKSNSVNVRRGPGQDYDVVFTFVRARLPVEITQEFDNWRKIRDADGAEGWVFHSLLSGERTALVAPWEPQGRFAAHSRADGAAAIVAYLEPKVVAEVEECDGAWCLISGEGFRGWVEQERLWGVYPEEKFEE